MAAPAKFLFDHDFAAGGEPAKRPIPLAEHARQARRGREHGLSRRLRGRRDGRHRRGRAPHRGRARAHRRRARRAARAASPRSRRRLETEAVEVAVAVARKLAPELIAREPLAEIAALAADCFRIWSRAPHVVVRVNDALLRRPRASGSNEIARTPRLRGPPGGAGRARHRARRLPHRMGRRRHRPRPRRDRDRDRRGGRPLPRRAADRRPCRSSGDIKQ